MRKNRDRWGTIGLYALMLCFGVLMLVTFLRTTHLDDNAYRLVCDVFSMNTTALCSILLYGTLFTAIGVRIWAGRNKHHHIKWCSGWNITLTMATYCSVAYLWSINDSTIPMDAVLHPLFWVWDKALFILLSACATTGFIVIAYGMFRSCMRLKEYFHKRSPVREYEVYRFMDGLDTLGDLRRHPQLKKASRALQRRLDTTGSLNERTGD